MLCIKVNLSLSSRLVLILTKNSFESSLRVCCKVLLNDSKEVKEIRKNIVERKNEFTP